MSHGQNLGTNSGTSALSGNYLSEERNIDAEVSATVIGSIRRLTHEMATESLRDLTDQQLVERALAGCDEVVFRAIVDRHGAMVYGVCWRVLRHVHDADDAFQATFLVFARNLRAVRKRASLASWLHGVARRTALKARARAAVRERHERRAAVPEAAPPDDHAKQEALAALDTELAHLPERWRVPLILCYLQGRTQDEAADQLGVSKTTVRNRLDEARRVLAERLTRRGVVWSAAFFGLLLSECVARAAPAPGLFAATVEAGAGVGAGKSLTAVASTEVASLAEGVLKAVVSTPLKKLMALVLVACATAFGAAVLAHDFAARPNSNDERTPVDVREGRGAGGSEFHPDQFHRLAPVAAPVPKDSAPPKMFLVQNSSLTYLDADGKEKPYEPWATPAKLWATNGRLSPDGGWVAALESGSGVQGNLVLRPRTGRGAPVTVPLIFGQPGTSGGLPVWSADSGRVLIEEDGPGKGGGREYTYRVYDLTTKSLEKVALLDGCNVTDWSLDGKRFLADVRPTDATVRVAWLNADGTGKPEYVSPEGENAYDGRLSPDGKWLLYQASPVPTKPNERTKPRLLVMNLATRKCTAVDEPGETRGHCWSPDGTRVAYTWQRSLEKPAEVTERETFLITCAPDGRNRKTVTSYKREIPVNNSGRVDVVWFFWVSDWR